MALTLLHFADLHLGVENHGDLDPSTGLHSRVRDFAASLERVFDLAIEKAVDLVLFAGDLYKNCDPTPTHQRVFARQLQRLQAADIPIVLVVGNHDAPGAFGKATSVDIFSTLQLEDTHVIRRPELLRIETANGPVQVAGLPWPTRHALLTRDEYRDLPLEEIRVAIQKICAARSTSTPVSSIQSCLVYSSPTSPLPTPSILERTHRHHRARPVLLTSTLANPAYDYVALGHIHKYQDLNPGRHPPVVYSGSLERIDFGEEGEDKGFCLVRIAEDATAPRAARPPLSSSPFRRGALQPSS